MFSANFSVQTLSAWANLWWGNWSAPGISGWTSHRTELVFMKTLEIRCHANGENAFNHSTACCLRAWWKELREWNITRKEEREEHWVFMDHRRLGRSNKPKEVRFRGRGGGGGGQEWNVGCGIMSARGTFCVTCMRGSIRGPQRGCEWHWWAGEHAKAVHGTTASARWRPCFQDSVAVTFRPVAILNVTECGGIGAWSPEHRNSEWGREKDRAAGPSKRCQEKLVTKTQNS